MELAELAPIDLGPGTVKSIAVGAWHICAILDDGSVKCWGAGSLGRLGIGTTDDRGHSPDEMGTNLPTVQLGGHKAVQLTAAEHTCALLDNGTVMCWGYNAQGQLGIGSTENALTPKLVNLTF
jgi:alpha-tubulin suppressor-like RCC1 family protein